MTGSSQGASANRDRDHAAPDDRTADRIAAFLRAEGAAEHRHAGGRSLLDHLVGTSAVARRWHQPVWVQDAALLHSVYGTDAHRDQLLPVARRSEVRELAGHRAERLAYLFCVTPRRALFAGTHRWARDVPLRSVAGERGAADEPPADRDELDALILLHMANMAEQARADDGSPGLWLGRLRRLAELLIDSDAITLPLFIAGLAAVTDEDEALLRRVYRQSVADIGDGEVSADRLALASAVCPVVAEPCVWQGYLAWRQGDAAMAMQWGHRARRRLLDVGVAWDKRLSFEDWLELAERLEIHAEGGRPPAGAAGGPRALYEALVRSRPAQSIEGDPPGPARRAYPRPKGSAATTRFQRYMDALADADGRVAQIAYPDLDSRPWYDPATFPLARYLQTHYPEIRSEILALGSARFHPESERIGRSGDWDVAFLFERGRRHDDLCNACPVTTAGIEGHGVVRTLAGLIYVSRMRAGTHIAAHRGPTNVRLRCHLGVTVPPGDCAIRVADEIRQWVEGECLVFDDHFEHEAWNHTEADRIVLIADLWHPDLSAAEIRLLEGLHRYADAAARQLNTYLSSNAVAAASSRHAAS
ncbi:MAG TPA: aspartyl/asparaginyl beta-hydroxylase domain-containing protein [Solirubrobacteraceae bacterium]|nr:aspartyl/asparaginyl beta-hydroxylase domain-containing protein [Solirubrobacteraceae bacterium]